MEVDGSVFRGKYTKVLTFIETGWIMKMDLVHYLLMIKIPVEKFG